MNRHDLPDHFTGPPFDHEGWQLEVEMTGLSTDGLATGHVDLFREGIFMCRIVLASHLVDDAEAREALGHKAHGWVLDWMGRADSGEPDVHA